MVKGLGWGGEGGTLQTKLIHYLTNPSAIPDVINSKLKLVTDWLRANKLASQKNIMKFFIP